MGEAMGFFGKHGTPTHSDDLCSQDRTRYLLESEEAGFQVLTVFARICLT